MDDYDHSQLYRFEPPREEEASARPPWRPAAKDAWRLAQEGYAAGFKAERICEAYGLSLSTFRTRARSEGWRRSDMEAAAEEGGLEGGIVEPPPALPTADLADLAWRSAAEAIQRGRVYEARAWMRLTAELKTQVRQEHLNARHAAEKAETAEAATTADTLVPVLHSLHPDDGVQTGAEDYDLEDGEADCPSENAATEGAADADMGWPVSAEDIAAIEDLEAQAAQGLLSPEIIEEVRAVRNIITEMEQKAEALGMIGAGQPPRRTPTPTLPSEGGGSRVLPLSLSREREGP